MWFGKQFQPIQAKHSSERYRSKLILKLIRTKLITFIVDMYVGLLPNIGTQGVQELFFYE